MAEFIINEPVKTEAPNVEVTITEANTLPPGRHRFRLVVVDDAGNESQPDEVDVIVADQDAPTAVLDAPGSVPTGRSFGLDGKRSFDAGGGQVVTWLWTYLGPSQR
ncbi:hypothetical protein [Montanilutibacter psychrotolerans]|uniref:Uncharacterized protein n=1 Tax=Montanilutibacter psychrotolerans TaxID=1327343 RepID=A0A3M8SXT9_9GAMM|nr:hypothetical protein [Lysobacter psychrotolerans]RNF86198.1 hypothetical protein EER27_01880 [Lysobacter psychrotolerans]